MNCDQMIIPPGILSSLSSDIHVDRDELKYCPEKAGHIFSYNSAGSPQTPPLACPWLTSLRLKKVDSAHTELHYGSFA